MNKQKQVRCMVNCPNCNIQVFSLWRCPCCNNIFMVNEVPEEEVDERKNLLKNTTSLSHTLY